MVDTADLDYVHLVQRLGATVGDTPDDVDLDPDFVPVTEGTITIVPTTPESRVLVNGAPVSIMNAPIVCTVDSQGYLSYGGSRGVWIVDLGSSKVTPPVPRDKAAYTITYSGLKFGTQAFKKAPVSINPDSTALAGADFNLTDATSLPLPSGVTLAYIQGIADEAVAAAASITAQKGVAGGFAALNSVGEAVNAVGEEYARKAAAAAQSFVALVKAEMVDPTVLVVGDSTSIEGRWPSMLATNLATLYPTHTIIFHQFDQSGATLAYNAPETISTGTGARTIHVYNASIGGHNCNAWKGAKGDGAFGPIQPDLTLMSMGHNEGVYNYWWHGAMLGLTEDLTSRHPLSTLVIVSQNPTFVDPITGGVTTDPATGISDTLQEQRREVYRKIAEGRGYGFIDATQAWLDSGHCVDWTSDGTHPTPEGSQFWADVVCKMFVWDQDAMPRTQLPSLFSQSGANLIRNASFASGTDYWTLTNVTSAVAASRSETASNTVASPTSFAPTARKFTALAGGNNQISQMIPVGRVKGKYVTVAVRQWVDSTAVDAPGAGVVVIQDSVSALGSTQNVGSVGGKDGWRWDVFTKYVDPASTFCMVRIYTNSGSATGANTTIDRVVMVEGRWPKDVALPA